VRVTSFQAPFTRYKISDERCQIIVCFFVAAIAASAAAAR
jgi:hypothetical protein